MGAEHPRPQKKQLSVAQEFKYHGNTFKHPYQKLNLQVQNLSEAVSRHANVPGRSCNPVNISLLTLSSVLCLQKTESRYEPLGNTAWLANELTGRLVRTSFLWRVSPHQVLYSYMAAQQGAFATWSLCQETPFVPREDAFSIWYSEYHYGEARGFLKRLVTRGIPRPAKPHQSRHLPGASRRRSALRGEPRGEGRAGGQAPQGRGCPFPPWAVTPPRQAATAPSVNTPQWGKGRGGVRG